MDIFPTLQSAEGWALFGEYKLQGGHMTKKEEQDLLRFIENREYLPVMEGLLRGEPFPPPRKAAISKLHSEKKRIVYIFPREENYVLKHMTHLLLRKYDHLFADNLYSFRAGTGVRDAIHSLVHHPGIQKMWGYKADIRNYFNSVPVERLMPMLESVLSGEPQVFHFLKTLLLDDRIEYEGTVCREEKGIMAGAPISTFLANLYLSGLDHRFQQEGILYARYSDDIILFAPTEVDRDRARDILRHTLAEMGLSLNPAKEMCFSPGEKWIFLGLSFENGVIDVAPASVDKLKAKMRRKARALARWQARKNTTGENAAKAFIRSFNRKLFANSAPHELTWVRWYFPLINTTRSLQEIDHYSQSCIRFLVTGKRTKAAYNCRYEDMKALGYLSLVNSYYNHRRFSENTQETVDS